MTRQELEAKLEEGPLCVPYYGSQLSGRAGSDGCIWVSKRKQLRWSPYKSYKKWEALHEDIQHHPFCIGVCETVPRSLRPDEDLPYYLSADNCANTCVPIERFSAATLDDVETTLRNYGMDLSDIESSAIFSQSHCHV